MNEQKKVLSKKKGKKRKQMSAGLTVFLTVFLICFMIAVVTGAGIVLTVFNDLGFIGAGSIEDDVAGVDYIDLDEYIANQSQTTIVYAYDEKGKEVEIARLHGSENRMWVDLNEVCKYLKDAFVAVEDKRFFDHDGVDWIRSIGGVIKSGFSEGGSTITQQLIKNLTGENQATFARKYKEIKNALKLEQHFDKDEILEAYLNTIYLDMGCYGVKTGAEYYFGKDVSELTLMESAILASITQKPRKNNPMINYDENRNRAVYCLDTMLSEGMISQEEYDEAIAEEVVFKGVHSNTSEKDDEAEVSATTTEYQSYYVDYVIDCVIDDLMAQYGYSETEAWTQVFYGGLRIYTAVDMDVQEEMEDVYYNRITFPDSDDDENPIQSAMVILDYEGRLVGIMGQLGKKTGNRVLNIAADSFRQPGSCIKPLSCYAPAIELDYYYWSSYLPNFGIYLKKMGSTWPTNYGGNPGDIEDLRTLQQALAPSLNTIPARIVDTLSPSRSYFFLRDVFKLSTLTQADADYAPMAIGAMTKGVKALDMAAAYVVFGSQGMYYEPWCYYKVTNASGTKTILETEREGEQVLSAGTADVMNHMMQTVVTSSGGTGRSYSVKGFDSFAKSGTTSDNKDKWFIGGTPYYVCAAWVGFEDNTEINTKKYGQNPAGKVYKEVMNRIHEDLDKKKFEYSDESVRRSYCTATGLLASSSCKDKATGWYKIDNLPTRCKQCSGS
ncbi:MAG: transglycosylase domain-containing protein [Clostridia bacterium]|nr:transglycosylase domain-containing protein [Clostridia bacterium]